MLGWCYYETLNKLRFISMCFRIFGKVGEVFTILYILFYVLILSICGKEVNRRVFSDHYLVSYEKLNLKTCCSMIKT